MLVNNAAANFPVPAEDMSPNAWRTVVDITLNGTFFCPREFGRRHLLAGTPGSIINIGASYAWTGGPGFVHSAAAKAGVKNLTESLAVEWGPYGIQVNGLVPGLFPHEDMTADILSNLDRADDKDDRQPALRVGQRQELGWAATFLASPYARFISGHTLVVDGANWQRRSMTNPPVVSDPRPDGQGPLRGLRHSGRALPDPATTPEQHHTDHRADRADDRPDRLAGHERALQQADPLQDPDRADQHQEGADDEADGSGHGPGPYSRGVLLFLRPITARLGHDGDPHGR